MMDTNSTAGQKTTGNVSIINFEALFNIVETDFSEWKFYDDSLYESALHLTPVAGIAPTMHRAHVNKKRVVLHKRF